MSESLFAAYKSLWKTAEDGGNVWVHYVGQDPNGAAGWFKPDGRGIFKKPEIAMVRPYYIEPTTEPSDRRSDGAPVDLRAEIITLAHEFGHYLSWKESTEEARKSYRAAIDRWDAIKKKLNKNASAEEERKTVVSTLAETEKNLILAEEERAWRLGRPHVPDTIVGEYERRKTTGLHFYRYRFGLDELWPDES